MSSELLYTSAPQGLRHGSRGFCTVLMTAGMPLNVISRLESISSYRHVYKPDHPQAGENPVSLSHQRLNLGGQSVSVLSRVSAYGLDYSRRTNKLAHHVLIDPGEKSAAGPAWVFRRSGVMRSEWLGVCETPPTGPTIPQGNQSPRLCTEWKNISGDAGWGGVVAESILSPDATPLWIVYDLGQREQLITLVDEAIGLLPATDRWKATFNTYAINIPPDVDCKIRMVPTGSEEARFAAASGKVIDLTQGQSITTASSWVERARGAVAVETPQVASRDDFSALQNPVQGATSNWSPPPASGPPPMVGPPELPASANKPAGNRTAILVAAAVVALIVGGIGVWGAARHLSGLPFFPAEHVQPELPPPQETKPEKRIDKETSVAEVPMPTLVVPVKYDQNQLLSWALKSSSSEFTFPDPVQMRGSFRMTFGEDESTLENAVMVSWGGETLSLPKIASIDYQTTKLIVGKSTFEVQALPSIPEQLPESRVYWGPRNADLIIKSRCDFEKAVVESTSPPNINRQQGDLDSGKASFREQSLAYREIVMGFSKISELLQSITETQGILPKNLQSRLDKDTIRSGYGKEAVVRWLIRDLGLEIDLASRARQISDDLRDQIRRSTKPLTKEQQNAAFEVLADYSSVEVKLNALQTHFKTLLRGQTIDVPELIFRDSEGELMRRIPLQFHFSW